MKTNNLFPKISQTCKKCNTCCKTYGWLLKKEANKLTKKGYPIIHLNKSIFCIDSFKRDSKGKIILGEIPLCRFYGKNQCFIQKDKPLDCKLFPIKTKFEKDSCFLGVSLGCKYVRNLNQKEKKKFYNRVRNFIKNLPNKELSEYITLMNEVYLISKSKKFWMKKLIEFKKKNDSWEIYNIPPFNVLESLLRQG